MSLRELKFSNQIQEEQIKSVYHKNFNYIVTERFYFQQQWLHAAYNRFKDFDKYHAKWPNSFYEFHNFPTRFMKEKK